MYQPYPAQPRQGTAALGAVIFLAIIIPTIVGAVWFLHTAYAWADCGATGGQAAVLAITRGSPSALQCLAVAAQRGAS